MEDSLIFSISYPVFKLISLSPALILLLVNSTSPLGIIVSPPPPPLELELPPPELEEQPIKINKE